MLKALHHWPFWNLLQKWCTGSSLSENYSYVCLLWHVAAKRFSLIFTWNVLVWITVIASKTEYISLPHTHHFSIFWLLMSRVWSQSTLNFVLLWGGMIRLLKYCCITSWKDKHMCNSAMEIEVHVRITTKGQVIIYDQGGDWVFFAWSWKFFPAHSSISYKVLWLTHTSCENVWGTLPILSYFYA